MKTTKTAFLFIFLLPFLSCSSNNNSSNEQTTSSSQQDKVPFDLNVIEHKFHFRGQNNFAMPVDGIDYFFKVKITNRTQKSLVDADFKKATGNLKEGPLGQYEEQEYPYVFIKFENSSIKMGCWPDEWKDEQNASLNNPWDPNTEKTVHFDFDEDKLRLIHFNYTPEKCILVIPITVKDPVGYKYSDFMVYDIMDDWKSFNGEITSTSQAKELQDSVTTTTIQPEEIDTVE